MKYHISFDFDAEGDPPNVFIAEQSGTRVVEVLEEPICTAPEWSWEESDWKPGALATQLLLLMNEYA